MACFIAPVTEAVITTPVQKTVEKKGSAKTKENPFLKKLRWLNNMLWGGSALLAFEPIWPGEVVPWFPFLTNAATPESASVMLHEIMTSGVAMAILVTAVWAGMVLVTSSLEKRETSGGKAQ